MFEGWVLIVGVSSLVDLVGTTFTELVLIFRISVYNLAQKAFITPLIIPALRYPV